MFEFYILIFVTSALLVRSIVRLTGSRFPHGADLAQISTYYYSAPLAILAFLSIDLRNMTFLNEVSANSELAMISLRYVCIAMLSIEIGRYIGRTMGEAHFSYVFQINEMANIRSGLLNCAVLSLFPIGIYLFGLNDFLQGYAAESYAEEASTGTALIYSAIEALGIILAFGVLARMTLKRFPMKPLIFLSIASIIGIFIIRVKRLEVISAMIPLAIILLAGRSRIKITMFRVVIGLGLVAALGIIAASRVSEQLNVETVIFYFLSEGLYAGHSLPGIINRIDIGMTGYEYGTRFFNSILAFVPGFLWAGKSDAVYGADLIFEGISPLGATTMLTEIVLQGGAVAVILFYGLLGVFFERVGRFADCWDDSITTGTFPARFGLYLLSVAIFIPHFRDGVVPALKLTYQGLVFFFFIAGIQRKPTTQQSAKLVERVAG